MKILYVIGLLVIIIVLRFWLRVKGKKMLTDNFLEDISEYCVEKKYDDGLAWALKIRLKNGEIAWNKTIPGSFAARDANNGDLTMVFNSEESARDYADKYFVNANEIIF